MPTVRRLQREIAHDPLRGGMKQAAATAQSEGAGVEIPPPVKFGAAAQLGAQITRMGAGMYASIKDEERQFAHQAALLKAQTELSDWENRRVYHPTEGALNLKGEAALPLPEDIREEFGTVADGIASRLTTDAQRADFARLRAQQWQGLDLTIRRHVFTEMRASWAADLEAHVDNSVNLAIASADDPLKVKVELQKATSAIATNAKGLGYTPEVVEQKTREIQSKTHVGVIYNLLSKEEDQKAEAYFAETKDQIAGDQLKNVNEALEAGSLRGRSQRKADEIIQAGGTYDEQLEKAKNLDDPKLRDEVEKRLEHKKQIDDRRKREQEEETEKTAVNILDRTGGNISAIPVPMWQSFSRATRAGMEDYAQAKREGRPIKTDDVTYYGLMQQAMSDPTAFSTSNLLQHRAKLSDADFKSLTHLQLSIRSGDQKASEKELAPFQTRNQLVDDTLSQHGINPNAKPNTAEGRAIAQLRRMVDQRVAYLQSDGKKASNQDIQSEIDDILSVNIDVPGSWWNAFPGGKAGPFGSDRKKLIEATIEDVTPAERTQVEAALRARGIPVSDVTVLDAYIEGKLLQNRRGRK